MVETGLAGGARIRTWEWRNRNPPVPPYISMIVLRNWQNSTRSQSMVGHAENAASPGLPKAASAAAIYPFVAQYTHATAGYASWPALPSAHATLASRPLAFWHPFGWWSGIAGGYSSSEAARDRTKWMDIMVLPMPRYDGPLVSRAILREAAARICILLAASSCSIWSTTAKTKR
jgi:hypothetical protein